MFFFTKKMLMIALLVLGALTTVLLPGVVGFNMVCYGVAGSILYFTHPMFRDTWVLMDIAAIVFGAALVLWTVGNVLERESFLSCFFTAINDEWHRRRPIRYVGRGSVFFPVLLAALTLMAGSVQAAQSQQAEVKPFTPRQERVLVYYGACVLEAVGKAQTHGFVSNFMRQFGVQIQIACMEDAGMISSNPTQAAVQGFLVGL